MARCSGTSAGHPPGGGAAKSPRRAGGRRLFALRAGRRSGGFSFLELLLTLGILAAALVPILTMYSSSHRIGHSARRLSEVTLHAQSILEALAELETAEFPAVPPGVETTLLSDAGPAASGGGKRYAEVEQYFSKKPPLEMERSVTANRLPTGEMVLKITVKWYAVSHDASTEQTIALPMLSTPRNWQ